MTRSVLSLEERLRNWKEGVEEFNSGRFWHAHEAWERGWLSLPELEKLHVQILIQVAGVLHLLGLGRSDSARALAARALGKIAERDSCGKIEDVFPRLEIRGAAQVLEQIKNSGQARNSSRAELLLSPE